MFRYIRNIAIVAMVFAFTAQVSNAQVASSVSASAEVKTNLTLTKLEGSSINFGALSATTPGTIVLDANGEAGNANTGSVTHVARFDLTGANSAITVAYDASVALTCSTAATSMTMTPEVVGALLYSTTDQTNATAIANASTITPTAGKYYIWVGGLIATLTNKESGVYTGTFNINVEYN